MTENKALARLREKQQKLKAQIKDAEKEQARKDAETLRKRGEILGLALIEEMAANDRLAAEIEPLLNARVTKARDRIFLGLPPLTAQENPAPILQPLEEANEKESP